MRKQILTSGFLGGLVMFAWLIVSHMILQLDGGTEIRAVPDQLELHEALKARISEPGRYAVPYMSPAMAASADFDYHNAPLYEVYYQGYTHDTVPGFRTPAMLAFLLAPMTAAWLLTMAGRSIRESFAGRVGFVVVLGLMVVFAGNWTAALANQDTLAVFFLGSLNTVLTWLLVGLIVAWQVRPAPSENRSVVAGA